jgi:ABC-type uncharacterized transport system substrate-binding protein
MLPFLAWRLWGAIEARPATHSVVVVASVGIEAHRLAIEGIQAAMGKASSQVRIVDLEHARTDVAGARLSAPGTRVIIAVGSEALQFVAAGRPGVPVISTMVLHRAAPPDPPLPALAGTISLDVSIAEIIAQIKQLFPGKTRLGVIRDPATERSTPAQLQARAQPLGFTLRVADATGPEQLLPALMSLKGLADFVWCMPDGALYNSATIKPLILASIENRLPLIGFSESFARAGAALGIYADFRDVGVQTGEAARQITDNQPLHIADGPRRLKVAVNQSVLRLLGLRSDCTAAVNAEVLMIR